MCQVPTFSCAEEGVAAIFGGVRDTQEWKAISALVPARSVIHWLRSLHCAFHSWYPCFPAKYLLWLRPHSQ